MKKFFLFFCAIFTSLFLFEMTPVHAIEYGGFGGKPAYVREDNPRTESIFIHTADPEDIIEEGVLVINNTAEKKDIIIYATDSVVSTGGAFACAQLAEEKKDVGSWIKLSKNEVSLEAGQTEIVPFSITVPSTASVGEHNGCILIQEKEPDNPQQTSKGIRLSMRLGLRVAISIPGKIIKSLKITDFKLEIDKEKKIIKFTPKVKNEGNVSTDANVRVITKYAWGKEFSSVGGEFPVLREQESEWNFEINKPFWGGFYYSQTFVDYNDDPNTELGKDNASSVENNKTISSKRIWFYSSPEPKALIIEISLLITLILFVGLLLFQKAQGKHISKTWVSTKIKQSENIKTIADKYHVSWKLIAKVNKLTAPYYVYKGMQIKVPPKEP